MKYIRYTAILLVLAIAGGAFTGLNAALAETKAEIDREVQKTLKGLYAESPAARSLSQKAKGVLVFPSIIKGGFLIGGQYGEGALLKDGKNAGYYNTVQFSYGLQAGLQKHGYVLFFMTEDAMKWLDRSDGWELGVGPSIVVVDEGMATSQTTTTLQSGIYAFFFDQQGLMGGLGLQGTKVTRIAK
jgi:lipid-binding SYLF domain-containing protein